VLTFKSSCARMKMNAVYIVKCVLRLVILLFISGLQWDVVYV
jgi:hypothetical protein